MRRNLDSRSGIAAIVVVAMSAVVLPLVGLSLDAGILYMVRTKLSAAADAAAVAGARSLSRGVDFNTQKEAARATAQNYFRANFPSGYFLSVNSSVDADVRLSGSNARVVETTATASVPIYFMRILPNTPPAITVNVSAMALRRDSNIVLVLDRSKSLADSGSCGVMKSAAAAFVDKFAEQRDYLGLVTFASSSHYMDFPVATNFKTASPSMVEIINSVNCAGGTNSAHGLWNAYTALAELNQPGALNVIVFFTDGDPTAFPGRFQIKATSPCGSKGTERNAVLTMTTAPSAYGLLNLSNGPVPVANDNAVSNPGGLNNTCSFVASGPASVATDVSAIPASDYFGDATNTGFAGPVTLALGSSNSTNAASIQNASINAADEAARHIRNGDPVTALAPGAPGGALNKQLSNVAIFSIGLGNAATPPNVNFLRRVANDPAAAGYDSTKPAGLYVHAQTGSDLEDAFERVAAEVLRIAR
jgi:Flp pilus assembly protein TadG